jgi:hypothetical protein
MENEIKKERQIRMGESEYKKLKRARASLLKAKNHIKIAWQAVANIKE